MPESAATAIKLMSTSSPENGWKPVEGHAGYYQYKEPVAAGTVVPVFNSVTCDAAKTYEQLNGIATKELF